MSIYASQLNKESSMTVITCDVTTVLRWCTWDFAHMWIIFFNHFLMEFWSDFFVVRLAPFLAECNRPGNPVQISFCSDVPGFSFSLAWPSRQFIWNWPRAEYQSNFSWFSTCVLCIVVRHWNSYPTTSCTFKFLPLYSMPCGHRPFPQILFSLPLPKNELPGDSFWASLCPIDGWVLQKTCIFGEMLSSENTWQVPSLFRSTGYAPYRGWSYV